MNVNTTQPQIYQGLTQNASYGDDYHHPMSMSSAARWHPCPGSVEAIAGIKDRAGAAALFGRKVHAAVERALKANFNNCSTCSQDEKVVEVADKALEALRSIIEPGATLLIEERVHLSQIAVTKFDPLSGTLDLGAWKPAGKLQIIDLKTGMKAVDPKENLQEIGYAIGAVNLLTEFELATIDTVELVIVQVNEAIGVQIKTWECSLEDLRGKWTDAYQEAVTRVETSPTLRVAGPHCTTTYCPAAAGCQTLKDYTQSGLGFKLDEIVADTKIKLPTQPTGEVPIETVARWLEVAGVLEDLVKQVKALGLARALEGEAVPDYKLVRSYGHKKWADPAKVMAAAKAAGIDPASLMVLKSPAQVGKAHKGFDLTGLWVKPEGDYKLVKDGDLDLFED